ncbi:AAA family ATPase [Sphingomonas echinoides]|uniref:AAA family ATPase n=1 Tax=Sphingomonas echinoides TaxID=59803 RepID=A0ABU4PI22_9SPHN|nr:AAA family ATPase [Sphingomonas echinoides]MDX5983686.1 AAA family ATPase [Sphingomonas echinoides]
MQVVDGKPHVRPCRSIPSDGNETNEWIASIGALYEQLTTLKPLAGSSVLTPVRHRGEPRIAATLRAEAPWMGAAIDRIADQAAMSLWTGRPWLSLRPMLLVGPPGAGKTHLARRLGALSGCGDAVLSFAGVNSNAELAGNPRGFRHQQPCFPAMAMLRTNTANPVVIIDEVEKACTGDMGDPVATLLGMLERSTAARYFDGCLAAEIDLSHVNWVLTANRIDALPAPLLSRVQVVEVSGPGPEHAEAVLATLWREVARDLGLPPAALPRLEATAETMLLRLFRNTRSVRRLRRAIETLVAVSVRHVPRTLN